MLSKSSTEILQFIFNVTRKTWHFYRQFHLYFEKELKQKGTKTVQKTNNMNYLIILFRFYSLFNYCNQQ